MALMEAEQIVSQVLESVRRDLSEGPVAPTGLIDLDEALDGGGRAGQVVLLAGRPGMGKVGLAAGWAFHVASTGRAVAWFTPCWGREQIVMRMLSMESRVPLSELRRGVGISAATRALATISELPLYVDDDPDVDAGSIGRRTATVPDLGLIVVDGPCPTESSLVALRGVARERGCPIIVLGGVGRESEYRHDKRPRLSDLAGEEGLARLSDVVLFVYRDEYYEADTEHRGMAEVLVARNRSGPTGRVRVAFVAPLAMFANLAPSA